MAYIKDRDIKDRVVKSLMEQGEFSGIDYHTETDSEFQALAERRGIFNTTEIATDDDGFLSNYTCKQWCVSFFSMRVCEDNAFVNNVEILDDDKYDRKRMIHKARMDSLEKEITYSMITGNDEERSQRVASAVMMRG